MIWKEREGERKLESELRGKRVPQGREKERNRDGRKKKGVECLLVTIHSMAMHKPT